MDVVVFDPGKDNKYDPQVFVTTALTRVLYLVTAGIPPLFAFVGN